MIAKGENWRAIANEAYTRNCDLIVLSTHGLTAAGFLHGSTMERVIRASRRPVLVVRDEPQGSYRNVLAAIEFSVASRYAVQSALSIAPDAEFSLLHTYRTPLPAFLSPDSTRDEIERERASSLAALVEQEMATFLGAIGRNLPTITCLVKEGRALDVIEDEVRTRKADLLVLGTHGRRGRLSRCSAA